MIKILKRQHRFRACLGLTLLMVLTTPLADAFNTLVSLPEMITKIENHNNSWLSMTGAFQLQFETQKKATAACHGELAYQRLDEKMFLKCFNQEGEILFLFKTEDRDFEFYIAGLKTLYFGNIFDIENSSEFESLLKPLDLYRALKLAVIPQEAAELASWDHDSITLKVWNQHTPSPSVARMITATYDGRVTLETYFSLGGKPNVSIFRHDYRRPKKEKPYFPHHITIKTDKEDTGRIVDKTTFIFKELSFVKTTEEKDWDLSLPEDTIKKNIAQEPWRASQQMSNAKLALAV